MTTFFSELQNLSLSHQSIVLLIGSFDGIHKGHYHLFQAAKNFVKENPHASILTLTFQDSIENFFRSEQKPMLFSLPERQSIFKDFLHIPALFLPMKKDFFLLKAIDFLKLFTQNHNRVHLILSEESRFGFDQIGSKEQLSQMQKDLQGSLTFDILPLTKNHDAKISTTTIKDLIKNGQLQEANYLLQIPFFLKGIVQKGNQKGRTIDFPTLNVMYPDHKIVPPFGVYETQTCINYKEYKGLTYISNFKIKEVLQKEILSETYLFDFDSSKKEAYGEEIIIFLKKFMRPPIKINNLKELKTLLETDKFNISLS